MKLVDAETIDEAYAFWLKGLLATFDEASKQMPHMRGHGEKMMAIVKSPAAKKMLAGLLGCVEEGRKHNLLPTTVSDFVCTTMDCLIQKFEIAATAQIEKERRTN